jgi:hypothetical protein
MSAVSAAGGFVVGAAKALAVPYAAFLVLLYTAQRSIIFQAPQTVADPTATGGTLVRLPACNALLLTAESKKAREKGKERLRESRQVYRQERKGVLGGRLNAPCVVAVYFKAQQNMPTLAYFHGNADQLGWGAAYIGKCLSEQYGIGFYGIEYPGYGLSGAYDIDIYNIYIYIYIVRERECVCVYVCVFGIEYPDMGCVMYIGGLETREESIIWALCNVYMGTVMYIGGLETREECSVMYLC